MKSSLFAADSDLLACCPDRVVQIGNVIAFLASPAASFMTGAAHAAHNCVRALNSLTAELQATTLRLMEA